MIDLNNFDGLTDPFAESSSGLNADRVLARQAEAGSGYVNTAIQPAADNTNDFTL